LVKVNVSMSRSKKSRKPGGAPTAKPKLSKQELEKVEKRTRKTTGKVAGNRQKEAVQEKAGNTQQGAKKDPRLGNKTPIALGKIVAKAEKSKQEKAKINSTKPQSIAGVRIVEPVITDLPSKLSPEQELDAIEQDEMLQDILAKQEDAIALTEQEVNYYNDMMERHQTLSAELGLDEDEDVIDEVDSKNTEDDLWDKLDNNNLSDFDDKESR
jgi:ribosome assembly protein YihI (activator of Der GTPase)